MDIICILSDSVDKIFHFIIIDNFILYTKMINFATLYTVCDKYTIYSTTLNKFFDL